MTILFWLGFVLVLYAIDRITDAAARKEKNEQ